ncbi:MAG: ABC transporter ATP-binding protein [Christensenellales bacterium]|jgi:ATP-binding cassette subfamily B protein
MQQTKRAKGFAHTIHLTRRFAPYFRPYWKTMVIDLFCASLTTLCELALPKIIQRITEAGMDPAYALTVRGVALLGVIYFVLRIIDTAANYYMQDIGHVMGSRIETDMRTDMFNHLQSLSHAYYDNAKIGQIMSRITADLNDITEFAHHFPEEMFIALIKIVVSFAIVSSMNAPLALIVFAVVPLMVYCSNIFSKRMRKSFMSQRHQLGELNARVEDSLSGVRVVKSFANEDLEKRKFGDGNMKFLDIKRLMFRNMAGFHSVTRLFDGVMYILVVVVGAIFMIKGHITSPQLVAILLYVTSLLGSIRRIVEFSEAFQRGITGIERFTEIMDVEPEIKDSPNAVELGDVRGNITFEKVSFAYADSQEYVLKDIDLNVRAGDSIALVGPSGGGKTTLCNLIPRFYDVTAGRILIDGTDIRDVTVRSLRSRIGVVQQDVYLFSGTVYENIEYGKPGATREEVLRASELAGAHEFIQALDDGYDTYVGERGVKLSGGQKQRISIARVFLKNPPILILDEATSALDNESEHLVQNSLESLMKGRTTFTIAHRLTTIKNAKIILVLTDEGIVESGSHAELIEQGGLYHNLYQMYSENS